MDFSKMSDDELDQFIAKNQPSEQKDLSKMSDEELDSFISGKISEKKSVGGPLETFAKSALNEATLGYLPQLAGALKKQMYGTPYVQGRDEASADLERLKSENPEASIAGNVAGVGASMLIPGGMAAKGAGLLSKIGRGALSGGLLSAIANPGDVKGAIDPIQSQERLSNATTGAAIGAAVPLVAKPIESLAKSNFGQKSLKQLSDMALVKQSGAMFKDFRQMFKKGRLENVAETMRSEGLYKAGDSFEDVASKAVDLKQKTGEQIGKIYQKIDDLITNPSHQISPSSIGKLAENPRFNPVSDAPAISKMIEDKYGKKLNGEKVVSRVNEILNDFRKRSDSLSDTLALKGELDEMINYSKSSQDLPQVQRAIKDVRNFVRDKTNKYVDAAADALNIPEAKNIKSLNRKYGDAATIAEIANDRVSRESANRQFGLTDYLAGGALGTAAGVSQGGLSPEAVGYGLAGALVNKGLRSYGPGLLSKTAGGLSSGLERLAPLSERSILPAAQTIGSPMGAGLIAESIARNKNKSKNEDSAMARRMKQLENK